MSAELNGNLARHASNDRIPATMRRGEALPANTASASRMVLGTCWAVRWSPDSVPTGPLGTGSGRLWIRVSECAGSMTATDSTSVGGEVSTAAPRVNNAS